MARPTHKADHTSRRQVEAMAAYGVPEADIARVVGIDPKTLRRHYRDELDTGHVRATAKVAESLFRKATGEGPQSVTAAIFWLKTRGGWREAPRDLTEADAAGLSRFSTTELVEMPAVVEKIIAEQKALAARPADEEDSQTRDELLH